MNQKYVLAIKRNNNDFLPLEWHLTPYYKGQDMSTLEGIDSYTKPISEVDLLISLTDLNILSLEERFKNFTIIYQEKGRIRELKDGPLFITTPSITDDELINFILNNMFDKKIINKIYNVCTTIKVKDHNLEKFKLSLNNLDKLYERNKKAPEIALNILKKIPYDFRRSILIRTYVKVIQNDLNKR
ncbi:MAG TPA: hypothetical protein DCE23_00435 [Firmicutes bacterium]|nr:hypothetical protein [Bacillota bacterium]